MINAWVHTQYVLLHGCTFKYSSRWLLWRRNASLPHPALHTSSLPCFYNAHIIPRITNIFTISPSDLFLRPMSMNKSSSPGTVTQSAANAVSLAVLSCGHSHTQAETLDVALRIERSNVMERYTFFQFSRCLSTILNQRKSMKGPWWILIVSNSFVSCFSGFQSYKQDEDKLRARRGWIKRYAALITFICDPGWLNQS